MAEPHDILHHHHHHEDEEELAELDPAQQSLADAVLPATGSLAEIPAECAHIADLW